MTPAELRAIEERAEADDRPVFASWRHVETLLAEVRRLGAALADVERKAFEGWAHAGQVQTERDAATQRAERAEAVVQAALGWVHDTGDCHFCGFGQHRDEHDDGCPLAALDATPAAGGPSISAPICPCNLDGPCVRGCSATPANETRGHGHE